jgi:hypothetical protein
MEAKSFNYNLLIISSVVTFIINLIEIPEMDSLQIKNLLGFSVSVSPESQPPSSNTMRGFIYKFLYYQLRLNTRLSNFVNNHPKGCTFFFTITIHVRSVATMECYPRSDFFTYKILVLRSL